MNSLSWLLYIAGVVGNLGGVLIFFTIVLSLVSLVIAIVYCDDYTEGRAKGFKIAGLMAGGAVFCIFLAAFVPSKETVYAIAASEMGEEVLKTPTAQKAFKALDVWLDKQIEGTSDVQAGG